MSTALETGYLHPSYSQSLAEFGTPRELTCSGGWILERQIPGLPYRDAMGCYPLFACPNWSQLEADLENIGNGLVTLSVVTDPFGEYDVGYLRRCFKDVVIPFKDHFITDLSCSPNSFISKHHRYYSRKALVNVSVEKSDDPMQFVNEWVTLYETLIKRHNLKGVKAFSTTAFVKQLRIPGIVMFRGISQGTTIGAHLWYVQGEIAYSHLAAFSPLGYELMASYAIYWSAIKYFSDKVRWLNLGAGAGVATKGTDGLSQFKRGWSTGIRTAYFCGRIFDYAKYSEIVIANCVSATDYFPAYREGELG